MKCRISPLKAVTGLALENLTGVEDQKGWKRGAHCIAVTEQIFPLTRRWVSLRCGSWSDGVDASRVQQASLLI